MPNLVEGLPFANISELRDTVSMVLGPDLRTLTLVDMRAFVLSGSSVTRNLTPSMFSYTVRPETLRTWRVQAKKSC